MRTYIKYKQSAQLKLKKYLCSFKKNAVSNKPVTICIYAVTIHMSISPLNTSNIQVTIHLLSPCLQVPIS